MIVTNGLSARYLAAKKLPSIRQVVRTPKRWDRLKVERQVSKSAAAPLIQAKIGQQLDAIVTNTSEKGSWVRILSLPVEGKLMQGFKGVDVGDQIRVQLISTNVKRSFNDFKRVDSYRNSK